MSSPLPTIADCIARQDEQLSSDDFAVVALGSNLESAAGPPRETVRRAVQQLHAFTARPLAVSSLWHSEPVDCPPGSHAFVNAVAALVPEPEHSPRSLLEALVDLEQQFGRRRSGRINEARALDLDLICWGQRQLSGPDLVLPHPRAGERAFVLLPLAELAPELVLPGQSDSVAGLAAGLSNAGIWRISRMDQEW